MKRISGICLDLLLAVALLLLAGPVVAETPGQGWFVEADISDVDASGVISGFTVDDDDIGASIALGFAFNRYFSVQVGYEDLGSYLATDCPPPLLCLVTNFEDIDISGWSAAATASWPIGDNFEIFGTLGVLDWDADFSVFPNLDDSSTDVLYGAGAAWWPTPHWRLGLSYEQVDFDFDSIKLALRYQF